MSHVLSQLLYSRVQDTNVSPRIITLHEYDQFARDVSAYGVAANPSGHIIGLQSYKGVFAGREITGYTWFVGPNEQPSPIFFGDALGEIERFLWDEIDRQKGNAAELPFLLGVGQGAIMALAAAAAVPDLLSGVIAVEGFLPVVPGWKPPLVPLDDLPILVLESDIPRSGEVLAGARLESTLASWGGQVARQPILTGEIPSKAMSTWLHQQTSRFHNSSSS